MLGKIEAKYIQSLFQKKFREQEKLYLIEGPKLLQEALQTPGVIVKKIYAIPEWLNSYAIKNAAVEIIPVTTVELRKISQLKTPHQVVATVAMEPIKETGLLQGKWVLALDGIQDPGNMGTIIRSADWFGITQIFCSKDSADVYNNKVIQASMGSLFRVSVSYLELADWLGKQPLQLLYGATLEGAPLYTLQTVTEGILVIGNESKGIREDILPLITKKITIPKKGGAESLNAAVAVSIILSYLN